MKSLITKEAQKVKSKSTKQVQVNNPGRGIGLPSMKKRLESVGGQLTITSSSDGTCVVVTIPYQ